MNDFRLFATYVAGGQRWDYRQDFMGRFVEDRRWLNAMRREFDQRLAAQLIKTGTLYKIERILPRQAVLLDQNLHAVGEYRDDGDWLDEALFPPSDMEVFARAHSEAMADFNRRKERENTREG